MARAAEHRKFPGTLPLIITGIGLGFLNTLFRFPLFDLELIEIPIEIVATLALFAVLFREGLVLNLDDFKKISNQLFILLASLRTIATTLLIRFIGQFTFELTLILALLFGSIFSPTDPVATFALFEGIRSVLKRDKISEEISNVEKVKDLEDLGELENLGDLEDTDTEDLNDELLEDTAQVNGVQYIVG